jgi:hypothetical protein
MAASLGAILYIAAPLAQKAAKRNQSLRLETIQTNFREKIIILCDKDYPPNRPKQYSPSAS